MLSASRAISVCRVWRMDHPTILRVHPVIQRAGRSVRRACATLDRLLGKELNSSEPLRRPMSCRVAALSAVMAGFFFIGVRKDVYLMPKVAPSETRLGQWEGHRHRSI